MIRGQYSKAVCVTATAGALETMHAAPKKMHAGDLDLQVPTTTAYLG
jgi:hypothetical protein